MTPPRSLNYFFAVLLVLLLLPSTSGVASAQEDSPALGAAIRADLPHATDHVLVKVRQDAVPADVLGVKSQAVFDRWHTVPVSNGNTPSETVTALGSRPGVELAELDYIVQLDPELSVAPLGDVDSTSVNDPYTHLQWHFPDVQADSAWSQGAGAGAVVAVVDTGISREGEDLACHTFVHPYNAITATTGAAAANDDHGHGTHVAGTVAQCTDNGVGVAGVAFDAALMPVKALDAKGSGSFSSIARGIDWARTHGADVINLSLGCDCSSSMLSEAIEAAADAGVVLVGAAGNSNATSVFFPANHPDVIAVGATDYNRKRAPYSNRGSGLDLVAPGGDNTQDANGDTYADGVLQETFRLSDGTKKFNYFFYQGTSMAAPHVSGAVALLLSVAPGMDRATVEQVLKATAMDLGTSGFDTSFGHGLIQIHKAIDYLVAPVWSDVAGMSVSAFGQTEITFGWNGASDNVGVTGYQVRLVDTTGFTVSQNSATITGLDPATSYSVEVLARDDAGNWSERLTGVLSTAGAFNDVDGHMFESDIIWMSGVGITRGCNPPTNDRFCPDDPVTRGSMAAFLVRALGLTENTHPGFVDVPADSTFAEDIGRLATAGITRGCNPPDNDRFCPGDPVTRDTMAAFLGRALDLSDNAHGGFVDVPASSTFATDIGRLATAGVTRGCNPPTNDRFCPGDVVTRGQLAAFLRRALG